MGGAAGASRWVWGLIQRVWHCISCDHSFKVNTSAAINSVYSELPRVSLRQKIPPSTLSLDLFSSVHLTTPILSYSLDHTLSLLLLIWPHSLYWCDIMTTPYCTCRHRLRWPISWRPSTTWWLTSDVFDCSSSWRPATPCTTSVATCSPQSVFTTAYSTLS